MLIITLGRQPKLGLAELEAVFGADAVTTLADGTVARVDADRLPRELGSAIKVARVIDSLPTTNFDKLSKLLANQMKTYLRELPSDGKVKLGLSVYDIKTSPSAINRTGLYLKNSLKRLNRSARLVPNKELFLSSAQVIHSGILSDVGLELVLVADGDQTLVGHTIHEQDIEAYGARDHGRPFRDAFVGMLPPKLAQIMINLASSRLASGTDAPTDGETDSSNGTRNVAEPESEQLSRSEDAARSGAFNETVEPSGNHTPTLLDPFCGTGVVLQEAALYGYDIYGTDLSEKMVRYTRDNIVWLFDKRHVSVDRDYEVADATTHVWRKPIDIVVCEGYLGQPLGGQVPDKERLSRIMHECNGIMRDFLKNIGSQIEPGTPLCIGAPAWFVGSYIQHLPVIDDLEELGFTRRDFTHASHEDLIYRREDQTTGRELLVLTKS